MLTNLRRKKLLEALREKTPEEEYKELDNDLDKDRYHDQVGLGTTLAIEDGIISKSDSDEEELKELKKKKK